MDKESSKTFTDQIKSDIAHTIASETWDYKKKNLALFQLFCLLIEWATKDEKIVFTTLFARLAFASAKYNVLKDALSYSHLYRKGIERGQVNKSNEADFMLLGKYVIELWFKRLFNESITGLEVDEELLKAKFKHKEVKTVKFIPIIEAIVFRIDIASKQLYFFDDEDPTDEKVASFDQHDKNEYFFENINSLSRTFKLPIAINLLDVELNETGIYIPNALVIQPDLLMDVTAIAECYQEYGEEPMLHLVSKYKPATASIPILIGNLVNFMLDELVNDPNQEFKSIILKMLHISPLGWAAMDDDALVQNIEVIKQHYHHLKSCLITQFPDQNINLQNIYLEPSFYARNYGIQGRLDLLHRTENNNELKIIELKSGKVFKPNAYGINSNHYVQALLYDLLIKANYGITSNQKTYILYSKESSNSLRYAPPVKTIQYEAIKLRNDILAIDEKIKSSDLDGSIYRYIKSSNFPKLKGFKINDINQFEQIYTSLDEVEKSYFHHYSAMVAREQSLAKVGEQSIERASGLASLWQESIEQKKDKFSILEKLFITQNLSADEDPILVLKRQEDEDTLVNFRVGDIGVLYPYLEHTQRAVLKDQIFKCTITAINDSEVKVKLRSKVSNQMLFKKIVYWNIEPDRLDSGFNAMFRSLFTWAAAQKTYRNLMLGKSFPSLTTNISSSDIKDVELTSSQQSLIAKMVEAQEYFLLWGPPGTGKTSFVLKHLAKHLYENTNQNILLLAYTNRAVDEICEALLGLESLKKNPFLRIGSRNSVDEKYVPHLLDQVVKQCSNRSEIKSVIERRRIYVGTISSVSSRDDLFLLKSFDTVIIDEASQVLEPMLVGFLTKFKKFILIGDHKQLPAIVTQGENYTIIKDQSLNEIGISDSRMSFFERIYLQNLRSKHTHTYGVLEQQGRMHTSLMEFPNQYFYEGKLQVLPQNLRQEKEIFLAHYPSNLEYLKNRKIYINTPSDIDASFKTNQYEAQKVLDIILDLMELYQQNDLKINSSSIGIITPFKAQIALIKSVMSVLPKEITDLITIDTVERYQGSARDIIIISFCINRRSQLENLISTSSEGIDRKLNVAITRAKEQLILIGNKEILAKDKVYNALIASYESHSS